MTTETTETTAPAKREVTPKLRCIVTGKERLTNKAYLEQKAAARGGDVQSFVSSYISREALKLLRAGKSLEETRSELKAETTDPIAPEILAEAIKVNGKWGKAK